MKPLTIIPVQPEEIGDVAAFIAAGYYDDVFFKWTVPSDEERLQIVTDYYKVYLNAKGCISHVAKSHEGEILGATVWLPHDVDGSIYDDIDQVAGLYAPNFRAVADSSHYSEPAIEPFYQLVGVVTSQNARGMGIGAKLLGHQLEILDAKGIPTYLEASTPYNGGGIYGKFGYQPVGELMHFAKNAVLYPLYRPAKKKSVMEFGGYDWLVLEEEADNYLLISKDVLEPAIYHEKFEPVLWNECSIRKYLNDVFLGTFSKAERERILESPFKVDGNPWFSTATGGMSIDPVFLLSVEEVIQYFGDSGQLKNPTNPFEIDDSFNEERAATLPDGTPARWLLRTPGKTSDFTCTVTNGGKISISGDFVNRASTPLFQVGIRPAIRLKKEGDAKNDFNQPFWA